MKASLVLHRRFGAPVQNPTVEDFVLAANELLRPTEAIGKEDAQEHPNSWLEYCYESNAGCSVLTVDAYENGLLLLTKCEDDDDPAPALEARMSDASPEQLVSLWSFFRTGEIEKLMSEFR